MVVSPNSPAWHTLSRQDTAVHLQTDPNRGLTTEQVEQRHDYYGPNELKETQGRSKFQIFLDQFRNVMLIMLIVVAFISGGLDVYEAWTSHTFIFPKDAAAILVVVVLNGLLGYVQETRAEAALAALKSMATSKVRVIRAGRVSEIDSVELVPGDVLILETGVKIAADGRLWEAVNLQVREATLTGEAHGVIKDAGLELPEDTVLGDRFNFVYAGTEVTQGRGTVIVTHTGMSTELGKIATALQAVETEPTPLQKRMTELGNKLVFGSLILVALVIAVGLIFRPDLFRQFVEVSLSMAVAVVPEGLPAVITVTLALGTQRMVKRNALIRRLPAVETLGSITTICSDKTGTLTQNKMVVQEIRTLHNQADVTGTGYDPDGELQSRPPSDPHVAGLGLAEQRLLLLAGAVCNDAVLQKEAGEWVILGDPTEGALLPLAIKGGFDLAQLQQEFERLVEFPFCADRKRMSVIGTLATASHYGLDGAPYLMFTKGSPELTLECCTQIQLGSAAQLLNPGQRAMILAQNDQLAKQGLRVLGLAYRAWSELPPPASEVQSEQNLVWLGLVGILDPPRPEVKAAVEKCLTAGIRPIMITGDHQLTAQAIATSLGICQTGDCVLTGRDLAKLSPAELDQRVMEVNVYARVSPEHKLQIVQALQRQGQVVAMTGDGVNDAPALKQADIGVAMGITGTDVTKEASDMVLLDDNFATIVAATEEGRVIYSNIRRFIKYILGSNIGEVLTIAAAPIIGLGGVPLSPLQILWMNLVTDGLPALALAVEPGSPGVMQVPPINPKESIFARGMGFYMVRVGLVLAIVTIAMMAWAYGFTNTVTSDILSPKRWATMVFTTLCIAQMGHALAVRSTSKLTLELPFFSNPYLLLSLFLTTVLQLCLIYVPFLREFFGTFIISGQELLICFGCSALVFVWVEMEKLVYRYWKRS
ncbi:cation-transporting P-type ATPase [Synechococcus sp. PCC 6312]|uniref:cation-translocating P-type ATPase n=1 Tax=Synechococcus sp. (strain ATCC 27167 / PCC 6312) TaxID=195253 RepID=UPI00029F44A9|nr:cation-transporting P-type ATPase [Synechococcus sp. PCC 6312]AFY60956.1 P-type ATPase, translocating [Synechococcus sp. PCC 6312]